MYRCRSVLAFSVIGLLIAALFVSCYKKDIQFGNNLAESHTRLITVDTVTPVMSTWVLDSFATSGTNNLFVGIYKDAYLGNTTASTYLQFSSPALSEDAATLIPNHAVYDSLVMVMRPTGYYYGDTTKPLNIGVYQLAYQPDYINASGSSDQGDQYAIAQVDRSTAALHHDHQYKEHPKHGSGKDPVTKGFAGLVIINEPL